MGKRLVVALIIAVIAVCTAPITTAASVVTTKTGTLSDGATYFIEVPSNWNRTLLLYSHGYVTPGSGNPARDVGDPFTRGFLLGQGYALAGSSYATTGWALEQAIPDQIATLDLFSSQSFGFGKPARTIAWGHSLGGIITGALLQTRWEAGADDPHHW
jgi:dipeptidyl aminopeptidase/acylaminoacyl peptidase